jgi:hypothetical protein
MIKMQKDHQKQGIPHMLIVLNGYVRGVRLGVTPSPMFGLGVTIFIMANMKKKKTHVRKSSYVFII